MRKFELICSTIIIITILYKIIFGHHLNSVLIMSITSLSIFYTYFSFAFFNNIQLKKIFKKSSYSGLSFLKIFGSIGLGFGLGLTILGILWKLMNWPFNTFFPTGLLFLLIIGIISLIKLSKTKSDNYKKILKRIMVIGGLGLIFWIIPQESFNKALDNKSELEHNIEKKN